MMKKNIIKTMLFFILAILLTSMLPVCKTSVWADENDYKIVVNRSKNVVTIYQKDDNGDYTVPIYLMACSTAKDVASTPLGKFNLSQKKEWRENKDKTYSQYAYKIVDFVWFVGGIYKTQTASDLIASAYNKIGESGAASEDCIVLTVKDAKWIYDNCGEGTPVEILVKDDGGSVLGEAQTIKIPEDHKNAKWDPTDPNTNNPWLSEKPKIIGAGDVTKYIGEDIDLMDGVTATDICGNDITSKVIVTGGGDYTQPGEYLVNYFVSDVTGATASVDVKLKVVKGNDQRETTLRGGSTATTGAAILQEEEDGSFGTVLGIVIVAFILSVAITKWAAK